MIKLNVDLKQEIHVIIQSQHFCLLDDSKNLIIKIYKTVILPVGKDKPTGGTILEWILKK